MAEVFDGLSGTRYGATSSSDSTLDVNTYSQSRSDAYANGPYIYVQHHSAISANGAVRDGDGYAISEEITNYNSTNTELSDVDLKKAYIFTVMENAYHWDETAGRWLANEEVATSYYDNQPNLRIASKYSINDIQTAYWWILDEEGGINQRPASSSNHVTTLGKELYERAGEYVDFVRNHDLNNFQQYVTIDGTYATMSLDRATGTYYVGPFTIDYPYYEDNPDISYLKAIQIKTNSGRTLTYSEDEKDFSIIMVDGSTDNTNGLKTEYPKPGSSFMVSFSASSANNPTSCTVSAECEYLALSEIDTKSVTALVDGYRYQFKNWYIETGYYKVTYDYYGDVTTTTHHDAVYGEDGSLIAEAYTESNTSTKHCKTYYYICFMQPYMKMEDTPSKTGIPGQNHTLVENGERIYKTVTVEASLERIIKQKYVNFSGTKSWVDDENEDMRPATISVQLYRDGDYYGYTTTSEDNDWVYSFTGLPKYKGTGVDEENVIVDSEGNPVHEYRYTIAEYVDGYTTKVIGNDIINTIEVKHEYVKIPVKKIWDDSNNWANARPAGVTMRLMRTGFNGTPVEINSVVLYSGNGWEYTFEKDRDGNKLPKYEEVTINGHTEYIEYKYTIKEDPIDGYVTTINRFETTDLATGKTIYGYEFINTYGEIKLGIDLGGYVWVDAEGGKQDVANGKYDSTEDGDNHAEARVQDITVRIYRQDGRDMPNGKKYLVTKTDEFGEYRFENLNAMYTYRVEFDYNGEYYEATFYADSSTWGTDEWAVNSNALEITTERDNLNNRFAQIGSYSENYLSTNGNKWPTYTREELLRNDVIDAHGILTENAKISTDAEIQKMVQFVQDCKITSYTEGVYPIGVTSFFEGENYLAYLNYLIRAGRGETLTPAQLIEFRALVDLVEREAGRRISAIYPDAYYINLGLHPRAVTDISVNKDIEKVTLEINNHVQEYTYDNLETLICNDCRKTFNKNEVKRKRVGSIRVRNVCPYCGSENINGNWAIYERISDEYYNTQYSRELYKSDYMYKASMYGEMSDTVGAKKSDELEVYVTYKIAVSNQSLKIKTRIDELVDYYDEDYTIVPERSYISINENTYPIVLVEESIFNENKPLLKDEDGVNFKRTYIRGIGVDGENIYLGSGEYAYFYVTFRVNKDTVNNEDWLRIDEDLNTGAVFTGKENVVELNGYSTRYTKGTVIPNVYDEKNGYEQGIPNDTIPAGIIDINSTPGNFDQTALNEYYNGNLGVLENDTDKAPNIKLLLYKEDDANRVISGTVWEDARTETSSNAKVADGKMQESETKIDGVTVQLVELRENGTEFVWREFGSTTTGVGTIGTGTGSGTKLAETPIINATLTNGTNLVSDYTFNESHKGEYAFKSFIPGNYVVRFIYGDTIRTVIPQALNTDESITSLVNNSSETEKGLNIKSYNGQDYKSTTYQEDITQNRTYIWKTAHSYDNGSEKEGKTLTTVSTFKADSSNNETVELPNTTVANWEQITVDNQKGYLYDITASDALTNVSDAKDIETIRDAVNNYSNAVENGIETGVKNYIAEVLASHKSDYTPEYYNRSQLLNDLMQNTKMTAETGLMVIEFEYDRTATGDQSNNNTSSSYKIQNVNLGLEERPKAQLALNKDITNVKVTLANGSILFDAKQAASNVLWRDHGKYNTGYEEKDVIMYAKDKIMNGHIDSLGLIQLTMDEEIMHGATIKIDYNLTVENAGEVDYYEEIDNKEIQDRAFYYTGVPSSSAQIVTTRADEVLDYVANNLQFYKADNTKYWDAKSNETIASDGLVNRKLIEDGKLALYNTIISTEKLNSDLVPAIYDSENSSVTVPLTLSQLITSENDTDDLTYKNIAEIVRTSNTVGRRMEYSVVGNQDPTEEPQEIDTDRAEVVRILPPFGETPIYLIISITAIVSIGIIAIGIIFIKKKIIK